MIVEVKKVWVKSSPFFVGTLLGIEKKMGAVNNYVFSSAYAKLQYIAVTGGVFCIGKVEYKKGKLIFTKDSFELLVEKLPEFLILLKKLGENLTSTESVESEKHDKSVHSTSSNLASVGGGETKLNDAEANPGRHVAQSAAKASLSMSQKEEAQIGDAATGMKSAATCNRENTMELSSEEEIEIYKISFRLYKKKRDVFCSLTFDHFSYMAFMQKLSQLLPFSLNPTPRQYDLLLKFQEYLLLRSTIVAETDFAYPKFTKNMATILKKVCESKKLCRSEVFMQKHFIGLNLSSLYVLYELRQITHVFSNNQ